MLGKGKKTLAAEQAAAAAAASNSQPQVPNEANAESPSLIASPTPGSPLRGSSKLGIAPPPQPFSHSQPTPSVITRMLQPGSFPADGPPGTPPKYYGGPQGPPGPPGDGGHHGAMPPAMPPGVPPGSAEYHPGKYSRNIFLFTIWLVLCSRMGK